MKFYIAAHDRLLASEVATIITQAGHECTSTWIDNEFLPTHEHTIEERMSIAFEDVEDVCRSDILVLVAGSERYSGGKFVEAGIALGRGIPVIVIGRRENMLLWHHSIMSVDTAEKAAIVLTGLEQQTPSPSQNVSSISEEVKAYIEGSVGVVEANSFETMCLWQAHHDAKTWVSNNHGYGPCVGVLDSMPVHVSLLSATVNGQKILFIDPTSQVVDWRLIDAWLAANLPPSAMRNDGRPNKVDAMNFGNVFSAIAAAEGPKE